MELNPGVRYGLPLGLLTLLFGAFLAYRPAEQALLTAPSSAMFPLVVITGLVLGVGCAILMLEPIPSRLVRRLGTIFVLAIVFYLCGNVSRGYYAAGAFPAGQVERRTSEWMVFSMPSSAKVGAMRRGAVVRTQRQFDAEAGALAQATPGTCFERPIDHSATGAERLAAAEPLRASDFYPCS